MSQIAAVASGIGAIGSFLGIGGGQKEAPKPQAPPPPPTPDNTAVDRAVKKERKKSGRGRASTILTSSSGLQDEATVSKRTLLGN